MTSEKERKERERQSRLAYMRQQKRAIALSRKYADERETQTKSSKSVKETVMARSNTWVTHAPVDFSLRLTEAPTYTWKRWEEGGRTWGQINDLKFTGISKEHTRMAMPMFSQYPNSPEFQKELADIYTKLATGRYAPGGRKVKIVRVKT